MVDYNARNIPDFFQVQKISGSNWKKIAVTLWGAVRLWNFWMIQKSKKFLLLQITQNGPIRENKWLKPKSGTFFCHFWMTLALQCLEASRLSHFSTNFSKKFFLLKMTQNGSIREKKWSKWKFENFALPLGPWVPDLVIFRRFSKMKT